MTKNSSEGITSHNICVESSAIRTVSLVSTYNQINASIEMRGKEANTAPKNVLRLLISATSTTITAVIHTLVI